MFYYYVCLNNTPHLFVLIYMCDQEYITSAQLFVGLCKSRF